MKTDIAYAGQLLNVNGFIFRSSVGITRVYRLTGYTPEHRDKKIVSFYNELKYIRIHKNVTKILNLNFNEIIYLYYKIIISLFKLLNILIINY